MVRAAVESRSDFAVPASILINPSMSFEIDIFAEAKGRHEEIQLAPGKKNELL